MKRISDPDVAHNLVRNFIKNDEARAKKRVKISGMVSGNPPFNTAKQKAAGQGKRCNVNFHEARGIIKARNASIFELFFDGRFLIESKLIESQKYQGHAYFWEMVMKEELTTLFQNWNEFLFEMMFTADSMHKWGSGYMVWGNKFDWKSRGFKTGDVLFPKDTKASIGYVDTCAVLDSMSITDLYEKMNLDLTDSPWNSEVIKKLIKKAQSKESLATFEWEDFQLDI